MNLEGSEEKRGKVNERMCVMQKHTQQTKLQNVINKQNITPEPKNSQNQKDAFIISKHSAVNQICVI